MSPSSWVVVIVVVVIVIVSVVVIVSSSSSLSLTLSLKFTLATVLPSLLSASTARAAQELVLGQSAPFSGASAQLGRDYRDGAMAWFSEVNRRGGIHGRRLRLVSLDDRYEPQLTLRNTKQLLGRDHAFALFGYVGTPTVKVILPLVDQQQVPLDQVLLIRCLRSTPSNGFLYLCLSTRLLV